MTLTLYPYKLVPGMLEARLEGGLALLPGQLLRFEGESPCYGEVMAIRTVPADMGELREGGLLRIRLLYGRPTMATQLVTVLTDVQVRQAVQELQASVLQAAQTAAAQPLSLAGGALTVDASRLGALTLIEGDDLLFKLVALMQLSRAVSAHRRVLMIDPMGVLTPEADFSCLRAGESLKLSLQELGSQRFLDAFGETLPESLSALGLRTLVNLWPASSTDFLSVRSFLALESMGEAPLRNLLLQGCYALEQAGVFANAPDEVMSLATLLARSMNAVDVSAFSEPWKSLFYEAVCREVFKNSTRDLTLVLISPESYLLDMAFWVQRAEETGIHLMILTSSVSSSASLSASWQERANNVVAVESADRLLLQGTLTMGLPVRLPLLSNHPSPEAPSLSYDEPEKLPLPTVLQSFSAPESLDMLTSVPVPLPELEAMPRAAASFTGQEAVTAEAVTESPSVEVLPEDLEFPAGKTLMNRLRARPVAPMDALLGEAPEESPFGAQDQTVKLGEGQTQVEALPSPPIQAETLEREEFFSEIVPSASVSAYAEAVSDAQALEVNDSESFLSENLSLDKFSESSSASSTSDADFFEDAATLNPDASAVAPVEADEFSFDVDLDQKVLMNPDALGLDSSQNAVVSGFPSIALSNSVDSAVQITEEQVPVYRKAMGSSAAETQGYQLGERLRHPTYGLGVITKILPMEENVILNITFDTVGKRLLDPSLCELTREADVD